MVIKASVTNLDELMIMATDLWPDYDYAGLKKTFSDLLYSDKFNVLLYMEGSDTIGFIYLGIRTDYVEGSDTSPVGYVEGIYVKPGNRRKGVAFQMLAAGELWLKEKGCTQIGSDIYIDNQVSYDFHTRIGFKEAGRLIAFIKDI
jgi:aminoglycoside 6'-N-acetyltransferase I